MMKTLWVLILSISLISCAGGGGSDLRDGSPGREPSPQEATEWGDLSCQIHGSCANQVLNLKKADLMTYFKMNFSHPLNEGFETAFECGVKSQKTWNDFFGPGRLVDGFLEEIINPTLCIHKNDLNTALENYFKQTKEYQDEAAF